MSNNINFKSEFNSQSGKYEALEKVYEDEALLQSKITIKPNSYGNSGKNDNLVHLDRSQDPTSSSSFVLFDQSTVSVANNEDIMKHIDMGISPCSIMLGGGFTENLNNDKKNIFDEITLDTLQDLTDCDKLISFKPSAKPETESNLFQLTEAKYDFISPKPLEIKPNLSSYQVYPNNLISTSSSTTSLGLHNDIDIYNEKDIRKGNVKLKRKINCNEKYQLERERNNKSVKKSRKKQKEKRIKIEENIKQKEEEEKKVDVEISRMKNFTKYI